MEDDVRAAEIQMAGRRLARQLVNEVKDGEIQEAASQMMRAELRRRAGMQVAEACGRLAGLVARIADGRDVTRDDAVAALEGYRAAELAMTAAEHGELAAPERAEVGDNGS